MTCTVDAANSGSVLVLVLWAKRRESASTSPFVETERSCPGRAATSQEIAWYRGTSGWHEK